MMDKTFSLFRWVPATE